MMSVGRWNYETRSYDPYESTPGTTVGFFSEDLEKPINCAQCGKEITFGEGYTSKEIHQLGTGFGYVVDSDCYDEEIKRFEKYKKK